MELCSLNMHCSLLYPGWKHRRMYHIPVAEEILQQNGWAHVGPKWVDPRGVGPRWAQVGPSQKFGTQKNPKIKILKIQIRSAQNVGKVWISRKKSSWPHLGPSGPIFCVGPKNAKNVKILPIFLGGPLLLSSLGALGKIDKHLAFFGIFRPAQKWAQMAPKGARRIFSY